MLANIKTLALLMLVAGLSLGVFAGTLLAGPTEAVRGMSRVDQAVEHRVTLYRDHFGLDDVATNALRRVLVDYRRDVHNRLNTLQREDRDYFQKLNDDVTDQILKIVGTGSKSPSGK